MLNLYRYKIEDTPMLNEKIIPGDDEPNSYGPVVYKRGELRIRADGFTKRLWSVWIGKVLRFTTESRDEVARFLR